MTRSGFVAVAGHFVDALPVLTREDKQEGMVLYDSGKMSLENLHPIYFLNVIVTKKLPPGEAMFSRFFDTDLGPSLTQ